VTEPGPSEIAVFVRGIPYARSKTKGRLDAPRVWTAAVVDQTKGLPRLLGPCELDVEFILPADKFPMDLPYGMDLDNLLKRLLDALGETILREVAGGDSAIIRLSARKRPAGPTEEPGARIALSDVGTMPW
jgi:Holliday junction resolvase RusA-like endonuclease